MIKDKIVIDEKSSNLRLDKFISDKYSSFTRSQIKKHIDDGKIIVNGKTCKAGYELRIGDEVEVYIEDTKNITAVAQDLPIDIVYQDDDIVVINKSQGMVVHPAVGNREGTLVNALLYQINSLSKTNNDDIRPGVVHRIDKDTSGLLVVAKNDFSHLSLSEQIKEKTCKRHYIALLQGNLKEKEGEIITNIGRDPKNRLKQSVLPDGKGKIAHTIYKVLAYYQGYTLCEFELKTGRTHQIRVHAKYLKHPIVGDKLYNTNPCKFKLDGQLLHAYKLTLSHPRTNELMTFEVELPDYFKSVLKRLNKID